MNKKGFASIEILAVIFLIAIVGAVVFVASKNSGTPLISQPSPTFNEMSNWKTYSDTKKGFGIHYPRDWEATKLNPYEIEGVSYYTLEIAKDNHKLDIHFAPHYEPLICNFPDAPAPAFSGNEQDRSYYESRIVNIQEYVQLIKGMRRATVPSENAYQEESKWAICSPSSKNNVYSKIGLYEYVTPKEYNSDLIKTMDLILSTYKQYVTTTTPK